MTENNQKSEVQNEPKQKKPDEQGGFMFSSAIKIFDPNTSEIIVQKRGDD